MIETCSQLNIIVSKYIGNISPFRYTNISKGVLSMHISFIGLGNMASALVRGIAKQHDDASFITGYNRTHTKAAALAQETGIIATTSIAEAAEANIIFLGVKPYQLADIAKQLRPHLTPDQLLISMAAGKDLATLQQLFEHEAFMRIMPNVNAAVGHSTTSYTVTSAVTTEQRDTAVTLLEATGSMIALEEKQFANFSAIAGASPAFHYMYIDAIARAAVKEGMPKAIALQIAADAVLGSAKMILQSNDHPIDLVDQVCSPGGTTIEGVMALKQHGFEHAVHEAVHAVVQKDQQLK